MTADAVRAWLAARRPAPPPALAARLQAAASAATGGGGDGTLAGRLALLGTSLLDRVAAAPAAGRELAADLLAADAMVTYAFEAQAEADVSGLVALADAVARAETRAGGGSHE